MKRDLKINFGDLKLIDNKLQAFMEAINELEIAAKEYLEKLEDQEGLTYEAVADFTRFDILEKQALIVLQLDEVHENIEGYIRDMEALVEPLDEGSISRVDRDDVWFNYYQISGDASKLFDVAYESMAGGSWSDEIFFYNIFETEEENESRKSAVEARNAQARAKRNRNYNKLAGIQSSIASLATVVNNTYVNGIKNIHDWYLEPYEDLDDTYANDLDLILGDIVGCSAFREWKHDVKNFFINWKPSDRATVNIMHWLSARNEHHGEVQRHRKVNDIAWLNYMDEYGKKDRGYIERQNCMQDFEYGNAMGFGLSEKWFGLDSHNSDDSISHEDSEGNITSQNLTGGALAGSGNMCEIIATYNAFYYLCRGDEKEIEKLSFPALVEDYELRGPALNGNFGTSMKNIHKYINDQEEYSAEMYYGADMTNVKYADISKKYDTFILSTYNNDKSVTNGIHTMCITAEKDAQGNIVSYTIHNDYNSNSGRYDARFTTYRVKNYKTCGKTLEQIINDYSLRKDSNGNITDKSDSITIIGVTKNESSEEN